jgi:hypothetical protein
MLCTLDRAYYRISISFAANSARSINNLAQAAGAAGGNQCASAQIAIISITLHWSRWIILNALDGREMVVAMGSPSAAKAAEAHHHMHIIVGLVKLVHCLDYYLGLCILYALAFITTPLFF